MILPNPLPEAIFRGPKCRPSLKSAVLDRFSIYLGSQNPCFLMARNDVWRYTLCLFHTFALFEKTSKNQCKMYAFWWLGTTFGVILFAYFTLSPFLKKIGKSMPKGTSKVMFFGPKTRLGRHWVDLSGYFWRFMTVRKISVFLMFLRDAKNR